MLQPLNPETTTAVSVRLLPALPVRRRGFGTARLRSRERRPRRFQLPRQPRRRPGRLLLL
jgi:hypothetical protein